MLFAYGYGVLFCMWFDCCRCLSSPMTWMAGCISSICTSADSWLLLMLIPSFYLDFDFEFEFESEYWPFFLTLAGFFFLSEEKIPFQKSPLNASKLLDLECDVLLGTPAPR